MKYTTKLESAKYEFRRVPETISLFTWALNYEDLKPFKIFCDIIGYSLDEYGTTFYKDLKDAQSGYLECYKIGNALVEYSDNPRDCETIIGLLFETPTNVLLDYIDGLEHDKDYV